MESDLRPVFLDVKLNALAVCGSSAGSGAGRAGAVGEVKRLLRSAFTSHCVTAGAREGRRGNRRKLAMRSFRRCGRINLTMHLARYRSVRN